MSPFVQRRVSTPKLYWKTCKRQKERELKI
jgi:hypothetical protein